MRYIYYRENLPADKISELLNLSIILAQNYLYFIKPGHLVFSLNSQSLFPDPLEIYFLLLLAINRLIVI